LNFSSDHVEPIKADHGTQPPPPTSSTFFRSLFISAPRAGLYPPSLSPHPGSHNPTASERAFSFSDLSSSLSRGSPPLRRAHPAIPYAARPLPSTSSSSSCRVHSLARPLSGNSLDFFASRGGVIYLAEVERGTHGGGGRRSVRGGLGYDGLRRLPAVAERGSGEGYRGRIDGSGRGEAARR